MANAGISKEIRDYFQDNKYEQALRLLDVAVSKEDGRSYASYSMLATCAMQLKLAAKAINALEMAVTLSPPVANLPKLWKTLSELYEEQASWSKYCNALISLYDIAREKGNLDRCITLAPQIVNGHLQAKLYEAGLQFVRNHLNRLLNSMPVSALESSGQSIVPIDHIWGLASLAYTLHEHAIASIQNVSSLSVKSTPSTAVPGASVGQSNTVADVDYISTYLMSAVAGYIQPVTGSIYLLPELRPELLVLLEQDSSRVVLNGLLRNEATIRSSCASAFDESRKSTCEDPFLRALLLCNLASYNTSTELCRAFEFLVESWLLQESTMGVPFTDQFGVLVQCVLKADSRHDVANAVLAWDCLIGLKLASLRKYDIVCQDKWGVQDNRSNKTISTLFEQDDVDNFVHLSLTNVSGSANTYFTLLVAMVSAAFGGFRNMNIRTILFASNVLLKAGALIRRKFPGRFISSAMVSTLVALVRVRAIVHSGQPTKAAAEAKRLLPNYFCVLSSKISNSDTGGGILETDLTVSTGAESDEILRDESENAMVFSSNVPYPVQSLVKECELNVGNLIQAIFCDGGLSDRPGSVEAAEVCALFHLSILVAADLHAHDSALVLVTTVMTKISLVDAFDPAMYQLAAFDVLCQFWLPKLQLEKSWYDNRIKLQTESTRALSPIETSLLYVECGEKLAASVVRGLQPLLKQSTEQGGSVKATITVELESLIRCTMGLAMWSAGNSSKLRKDKSGCIAQLLAAGKLDPSSCDAFAVIGHYYALELNDTARAAKCYERVLLIDATHNEAGIGLSQVYFQGRQTVQCEQLWSDIAKSSTPIRWCLILRGLYFYSLESFEVAAESFQRALDVDDTDAVCWNRLGCCYGAMGKYSAAQKALLRALELSPRDLQIQWSLADVEKKQCLLSSSKLRFQSVIQEVQIRARIDNIKPPNVTETTADPIFLMASKGLAEVCLLLSFQYLSWGWTMGAAKEVVEGVAVMSTALASFEASDVAGNTELKCVFLKLMGDLCCFVVNLPPEDIDLANQFQKSSEGHGSECKIISLRSKLDEDSWQLPNFKLSLDLLRKGQKAYEDRFNILSASMKSTESTIDSSIAVNEQNEANTIAMASFDIGVSIYDQSSINLCCAGQGSAIIATHDIIRGNETISSYLHRAQVEFQNGIKSSPSLSACWNGLGVCLFSNLALKRACFVRAIQIDSNTAAYANLSLLLTSLGQDDEAKKCLCALQALDNNPLAWINVAISLERSVNPALGEDLSNRSEIKYSHLWSTFSVHESLAVDIDSLSPSLAAFDAYIAASEIAKPPEASLGSAIAWLKLRGFLKHNVLLMSDELSPLPYTGRSIFVDAEDIRFEVEMKLRYFLGFKPLNPLGWILLSASLELRQNYNQACSYLIVALRSLNVIIESTVQIEDKKLPFRCRHAVHTIFNSYFRCAVKRMLLTVDSQSVEFTDHRFLIGKGEISAKLFTVLGQTYEEISSFVSGIHRTNQWLSEYQYPINLGNEPLANLTCSKFYSLCSNFISQATLFFRLEQLEKVITIFEAAISVVANVEQTRRSEGWEGGVNAISFSSLEHMLFELLSCMYSLTEKLIADSSSAQWIERFGGLLCSFVTPVMALLVDGDVSNSNASAVAARISVVKESVWAALLTRKLRGSLVVKMISQVWQKLNLLAPALKLLRIGCVWAPLDCGLWMARAEVAQLQGHCSEAKLSAWNAADICFRLLSSTTVEDANPRSRISKQEELESWCNTHQFAALPELFCRAIFILAEGVLNAVQGRDRDLALNSTVCDLVLDEIISFDPVFIEELCSMMPEEASWTVLTSLNNYFGCMKPVAGSDQSTERVKLADNADIKRIRQCLAATMIGQKSLKSWILRAMHLNPSFSQASLIKFLL